MHFPDAGIYWYHPHVREDIEQAMGLFGNMLVDSPDRDYYSPVNREETLVLDDLLVNGDTLIPFGKEAPDYALMGRVGNVLLVNGEPRYALRVKRGEVVRFFITNVSSSRTFNLSFGGAPIKVVASDVSRFEREERVPSVVLAPAERYVVEVRFDRPGRFTLVNAIQAINHYAGEFSPEVDTLGAVTVDAAPATPDYAQAVRDAARERRTCRATSIAIARTSTGAGQDAHAHRRDERAAARDRAVHERRHGVLRAGRVGRRHAGHELAVDEQAGALDSARRRDGQGEHGHRLARARAGRS